MGKPSEIKSTGPQNTPHPRMAGQGAPYHQKERLLWLSIFQPNEFSNFEPKGSKIDQQSMYNTRGFQVTKNLSLMLRGQFLDRLEFDDQFILNK